MVGVEKMLVYGDFLMFTGILITTMVGITKIPFIEDIM